MNYESIIIEMLSRIKVLEEQVAKLTAESEKRKEETDMSIREISDYIEMLKSNARVAGKKVLVLKSGDIHKDLNLNRRMPSVCRAMYYCQKEGDVVLHTTPSGFSSTIEIEYQL